jgi:uncharacterized repeat protein (TIGR03803 family)
MRRNGPRPDLAALRVLSFLAITVLFATTSSSRAGFNVVYSFCGQANCADGADPEGGLIPDSAGNLFGTAASGGESYGTLYELSPSAGAWTFSKLYDFCSREDCTDGAAPTSSLIMDTDANLYGVTRLGGGVHHSTEDAGTVFELGFDAGKGVWLEKRVHDFCGEDCTHRGYEPFAALTYADAASGALYDGTSPLFGVTAGGGNLFGDGVAFELVPNEGKKSWDETVIYEFCRKQECPDGYRPETPLIPDGSGNLIGTVPSSSGGLVYSLSPSAQKKWKQTVLWAFCQLENCTDGTSPQSGLLKDAAGALYGTTTGGGKASCSLGDCGTVFKLTSNGAGWQFNVIHKFCSEFDCRDGMAPAGTPLVMDAQGNLYGATPRGGNTFYDQTGGGTVFEITAANTFKVLHRFCARANCPDGDRPISNLTFDASGRLFGVTNAGGAYGHGVVYEVTP